ncbi:reverse transcriptase [Tanacetum coccineum]
MVVSTRNTVTRSSNGSPLVLDEETKRFLAETIVGMVEGSLANIQRSMADMANDINALSLPQEWISWEVYKSTILARFCNVYVDPMSELTNLKYETTAREYEDAFDSLLCRVEVSEEYNVSLFMGGLPTEIEMGVRMFKRKTLAYAYCLTNLQEATLNAIKKNVEVLLFLAHQGILMLLPALFISHC